MKKLQRLLQSVAVLIIAANVVPTASAIEQLKVAVKSTNAILSWPSVAGDTYIVRYRTAFTNQWTMLTNSYPAASGTNRTVFTNYGAVIHVMTGTNGGGTNGSPPPLPSPVPDVPTASEITLTGGNIDNGAAHYSYWLSYLTASGESFVSPACPAQSTQNGGTPVPNKAMHVVFPTTPAGVTNIHVWRTYVDSGHAYNTATFPTNVGLLSALATNNTYYNDGESTSQFAARVNHSIIPPMQTVSTNTNIFIMDAKLYQVVKSGVHLYGITNGTKLTGVVPLKVEFGNTDTNGVLAGLFLTDTNSDGVNGTISGTAFPYFNGQSTNVFKGFWDTTQLSNGTYTVQLGAILDDGTLYNDHPVMVTVTNRAWLPDPWSVGGEAIYIGVQTPYRTGTWRVDVYDDTGVHFGAFTGIIDAHGYLSYSGNTNMGFSLNNTDGSGNQLPSTYYTLVYSADSGHPLSTSPPYTFTNITRIEKSWNFATDSTICYFDVFGNSKPFAQASELAMMQAVASVENSFHPLTIGDTINVFQVPLNGSWTAVLDNGLDDTYSRDFIYFGHGSPTGIGTGSNFLAGGNMLAVSNVSYDLNNPLANGNDIINGYPFHPYRFVFLDGCDTAEGDWPLAFGIPKKTGMTIADFTKRGIRPRAFMGWNRKKQIGWIGEGEMNPDHVNYISDFWTAWSSLNPATSQYYTVSDAIAKAGNHFDPSTGLTTPNPASAGMVLYGAKDLTIVQ